MMNRRDVIRLCALAVCVLLLMPSCVSSLHDTLGEVKLDVYPYPHDFFPEFWITYYPYFSNVPQPATPTNSPTSLANIRALRDETGAWTDDNMLYDLAVIEKAGFSGVVLMLAVDDLLAEGGKRLSRILQFFTLTAQRQSSLRIGLYLTARERTRLGSRDLAYFLTKNRANHLQAKLTSSAESDALLVLIDAAKIELVQQDFPEEKPYEWRFCGGTTRTAWPAFVDIPAKTPVIQNSFAWIHGASAGTAQDASLETQQHAWQQPRGDGSFMVNRLRHALKRKAAILCIHSWNKFADGSFLVPNTFDRDTLLNAFTSELATLEALQMKATKAVIAE